MMNQLPIRRVVVDDQHAQPFQLVSGCFASLRLLRLLFKPGGEPERRAFSGCALDSYLSSQQFDKLS